MFLFAHIFCVLDSLCASYRLVSLLFFMYPFVCTLWFLPHLLMPVIVGEDLPCTVGYCRAELFPPPPPPPPPPPAQRQRQQQQLDKDHSTPPPPFSPSVPQIRRGGLYRCNSPPAPPSPPPPPSGPLPALHELTLAPGPPPEGWKGAYFVAPPPASCPDTNSMADSTELAEPPAPPPPPLPPPGPFPALHERTLAPGPPPEGWKGAYFVAPPPASRPDTNSMADSTGPADPPPPPLGWKGPYFGPFIATSPQHGQRPFPCLSLITPDVDPTEPAAPPPPPEGWTGSYTDAVRQWREQIDDHFLKLLNRRNVAAVTQGVVQKMI